MTTLDRNEIIKQSAKKDSYWRGVWRRLKRNRLAIVSAIILIIIALACILVPMFSKYSVSATDVAAADSPPTAEHLLGTANIGRDLLVRLFYGGRISLGVAISVTALECVIGIVLGAVSGFFGGIVDTIIMRISEVFMCFPFLMICITLQSIFGTSVKVLIFILSILSWPSIARIIRGQILSLR